MLNKTLRQLLALLALAFSSQAFAVFDDFTQATDPNSWVAIGYACLTAGTAANNSSSATGSPPGIPGCNYSTPDAVGSGALRLTPAAGAQHGAIVSTTPFPSNAGLQVTFTTYAYGGSKDGDGSEGADGISFFLIDPSQYANISSSLLTISTNLGSWGGSLAYSCSNVNTPYVGLTGAYLGLGMDEYGNFLNGGSSNDNTATGIPYTSGNTFDNGGDQQANRIGLRGMGDVSWPWLTTNYPYYYPSSLSASNQETAVQNTCETGYLWDYSGASSTASINISGNPTVSGTTMTVTTASNGEYGLGDTVKIGGTITASGASQAISSASVPSGGGSTMTVAVPSVSGYTSGESITIGGTIVANYATQTISGASSSGATLTVTMPSTASMTGYATGGYVTLGGNITATQSISSTPSVSGSTMTLTVANASDYHQGDTVTFSGLTGNSSQNISGTPTVSGTTMTVAVPSVSGYTNGESVTLAGLTASTTQNISSVSVPSGGGTTMTVNVQNGAGFAAGESVSFSGITATAGNVATITALSATTGGTLPTSCLEDNGKNSAGSTRTWCIEPNNSPAHGTDCTSAFGTGNQVYACRGESSATNYPDSGNSTPDSHDKACQTDSSGNNWCIYSNNTTAGTSSCSVVYSGNTLYVCKATTATLTVTATNDFSAGDSVTINSSDTITPTCYKATYTISSATSTSFVVPSPSGCSGTIALGAGPNTATDTTMSSSAPSVTSGTVASISGNTLTVTIPSAAGSVSCGSTCTISATAPSASGSFTINSGSINTTNKTFAVTLLSPAYSITCSTSPCTVSVAGAGITSGTITGISGNTLTISLSSSPSSITDSSGTITDTLASSTPYLISGVNTSSKTFTITLPFTPTSVSNSSGTALLSSTSVDGGYSINSGSINTTNNTFTVTLTSSPSSITNTSGTVAVAGPTISGNSYTITSVTNSSTSSTFTVTLASSASSITNTSGTVTDTSNSSGGRQLTQAVADYGVIPGGYEVLPSSQLLASESVSSRANLCTAGAATSSTAKCAWPVTYKLQITPNGLLNFFYSYNGGAYQTVLSGFNIATNNGSSSAVPPAGVPANFLFGFAGSTGGSWNVHEISCFDAEPMESSSSASANAVESGQIRTTTLVYLASYNPTTVSGSLVAEPLLNNNGVVTVSSVADWDASCVLTGGVCTDMANSPTITAETPTWAAPVSFANNTNTRQLITWNGSQGVPLEWANLTAAQQTLLNSTDTYGQYRLNYLRGDRSEEQTASPAGPLRVRASVLADIVDSSPLWIGPPSQNIGTTFADFLYGAAVIPPETSYPAYATSFATRLNVVYSGANDGLLHGFRAGSFQSDGVTFNSTYNDGQEVLGFMPSTVLANSNVVSFTNPSYGHDYFVDAPPGMGDLFYNGQWHTWLASGLGAGGNEVFVLDVTDPTGVQSGTTPFSENNAAALVMGDWTSSTLTCQTVAGVAVANCGNNLGQTYGTPVIRRMHNGQWAVIFGNGLNSANGHAGVFIGLVNPGTAAITLYWLDTGAGSSASPDSIEYVVAADLDGDFIADYLYAGDTLGNVWRFDVTSTNVADWHVSTYGQPSPAPLFKAGSSGDVQPITTKIVVTVTYTGSLQRVLLGFGTGQVTPAAALTSSNTYAPGTQSVYGIWDWDMAAWDNGTTTTNGVVIPPSTTQFAYLSEITTSPYLTFNRSNLLVDVLASETATANGVEGTRTMAMSDVCWVGTSTCPTSNNPSTANNEYGWLFDLPDTDEQVIYSPTFAGGDLILNTTVPPVSTPGQCKPVLPTGWTMVFNMASGGGFNQNVFANPTTGSFTVTSGSASITGVSQGSVGTPYILSVGSQQYLISPYVGGAGGGTGGGTGTGSGSGSGSGTGTGSGSGSSGSNNSNANIQAPNLQGGINIHRTTWEEIR